MMIVELFDIPKPEQINTPHGRIYRIPISNKLYPSVSTILGSRPNIFIDQWKKAVGDTVAARISKAATDSGTLVHDSIEYFILTGRNPEFSMFQKRERDVFYGVKSYISTLEKVFCLETPMWSDTLRVAGTVDCAAYIGGIPTVIDWKTSQFPKGRDEIYHYFEQASAYALMIYERTGIAISDISICMMVYEMPNEPIIFKAKVKDHLQSFLDLRNSFDSSSLAKELIHQCELLSSESS